MKRITDTGDAKEYYYKVMDAKEASEPWAANIPCDPTTIRANQRSCLSCGCPEEKMDDCFNPSQCKQCGIKHLLGLGYSQEDAESEHKHRQERKLIIQKFKEMVKRKKVSNVVREELDVMF